MREESAAYLAYVRGLPCCHCGQPYGSEPHHIIGVGLGVMGSKADDIHSMPLCRNCHDMVHKDPQSFPQVKWMIKTQHLAQAAGYIKA